MKESYILWKLQFDEMHLDSGKIPELLHIMHAIMRINTTEQIYGNFIISAWYFVPNVSFITG